MPIVFDEVTADLTPATSSAPASASESRPARLDPLRLAEELQRLATRAARLSAD